MRNAADVGMEIGRQIARNYPDVNLYCANCKQKIDNDAPVVILVTVARNPLKTGAAERGQDFDGYDASLCSSPCLQEWGGTIQEGY